MRPLQWILTLAAGLAAAQPVCAQAPAAAPASLAGGRTLTIVVPFPAGGGPDLAARTLGEKLAKRLGQTVIVDNRPGVGGLVGARAVARAGADGSTLLLAPNTLVISPHVLPTGASGGVDVLKDLTPILTVATTPILLVAHPRAGVGNLQQLLSLVAGQPGLAYGSAGNGSPMHFAGVMFSRAAGVNLLHVPYRGVAPSVVAALGGEVPLLFVPLGGVSQHLKSGKLVALGVAERSRSALLPEVPTLAEGGILGVEVNAWYGLFAPAGTPAAVVARLNQEFNAVLSLPEVRERLGGAGIELAGGSPQALAATMALDHDRYGRLARELQIRAD